MDHIKKLIESMVAGNPAIEKKINNQRVVEIFNNKYKEKGIMAYNFSNGTIFTVCENASTNQEMVFSKTEIMDQINMEIGEIAVKDIRAKSGTGGRQ